ncbi:alpha/beta hydrolase [Embleya scabrispora]|uniref:Alpha/beta hydrolase n=1 Tax=Embleya scabrispora TaxID=159449 RepID=A0A1T3NIE3_9ACTN|nr:alpha/beta hydrolase [Embleya scabrispora]OPC76558.1 alpha/beta hydrolase [Embleya scabrispora]
MEEFTYHGHDGGRLYSVALGAGPALVGLHGGGPDHHSLLPLAERLADRHRVLLPDIRGYGRSICRDPDAHTWDRYTDDVFRLLDDRDVQAAVLVGTGLGATVSLRAALARPERVIAVVAISLEDIEDDTAKAEERAMLDAFAHRARTSGVEAAWAPLLPVFPPLIRALVRDGMPRADARSIAAAAAIGRDRAFRHVDELGAIRTPVLIIPGGDARHPSTLAVRAARVMPAGTVSTARPFGTLHTAEDLAKQYADHIHDFAAAASPHRKDPLDPVG